MYRLAGIFLLLGICDASVAGETRGFFPRGPLEFATTIPSPQAVALADVNRDDLVDAVVVGESPAAYAIYAGRGTGTFGGELASDSLFLQPGDLTVGDFNNDGFPDMAAINNACT